LSAAGIFKERSALDHLLHWWGRATPDERAAFERMKKAKR
jgi:hypothetical protein